MERNNPKGPRVPNRAAKDITGIFPLLLFSILIFTKYNNLDVTVHQHQKIGLCLPTKSPYS